MNNTTRKTILEQQELNRKIHNKENTTTEYIQQQRIDVLNETIDIMNKIINTNEERINILKHTIEINNKTIEIQRHDNNLLLQHANKKTNE